MANTNSPQSGTRKTHSTVAVVGGNKPMKLTTRGKVVLAFGLALLAIGLFVGVDHLNWMGDHYCFKTMAQCYLGGK